MEKRILLVEDHEDTSRVTARLLKMEGYNVRTARTAALARQACAEEIFDLVICDIGLPDGNGHDLMREIREQRGIQGIGLTGFTMDDDEKGKHGSAFAEYLIKPIELKMLTAAITRVIPKA
jgi:DNA-binding response OmpR family regulator